MPTPDLTVSAPPPRLHGHPGAPAAWPAELRLTIDIMFNTPLAMLLMWGPEQRMLYNPAYAALLGVAPMQPGDARVPPVLPAAWSWNRAAIDDAWAGHSTRFTARRLPSWRDKVQGEHVVDLHYTPIRDGQGGVAGILCTLAPPALAPTAAGPLRILVVEDNPDARYLACETLAALGHTVQAAASGEEALDALDGGKHQLLFTDVSLPGISGIELARLARARRPGLRLLFASGHGDALARHLDFPAPALQKPYDIEQLQAALEAISQDLQDGAA